MLEVDSQATVDEVRRAHRALILKWHPDQRHGDAAAHERTIAINRAWDVLRDDTRRRAFDLELKLVAAQQAAAQESQRRRVDEERQRAAREQDRRKAQDERAGYVVLLKHSILPVAKCEVTRTPHTVADMLNSRTRHGSWEAVFEVGASDAREKLREIEGSLAAQAVADFLTGSGRVLLVSDSDLQTHFGCSPPTRHQPNLPLPFAHPTRARAMRALVAVCVALAVLGVLSGRMVVGLFATPAPPNVTPAPMPASERSAVASPRSANTQFETCTQPATVAPQTIGGLLGLSITWGTTVDGHEARCGALKHYQAAPCERTIVDVAALPIDRTSRVSLGFLSHDEEVFGSFSEDGLFEVNIRTDMSLDETAAALSSRIGEPQQTGGVIRWDHPIGEITAVRSRHRTVIRVWDSVRQESFARARRAACR